MPCSRCEEILFGSILDSIRPRLGGENGNERKEPF